MEEAAGMCCAWDTEQLLEGRPVAAHRKPLCNSPRAHCVSWMKIRYAANKRQLLSILFHNQD